MPHTCTYYSAGWVVFIQGEVPPGSHSHSFWSCVARETFVGIREGVGNRVRDRMCLQNSGTNLRQKRVLCIGVNRTPIHYCPLGGGCGNHRLLDENRPPLIQTDRQPGTDMPACRLMSLPVGDAHLHEDTYPPTGNCPLHSSAFCHPTTVPADLSGDGMCLTKCLQTNERKWRKS